MDYGVDNVLDGTYYAGELGGRRPVPAVAQSRFETTEELLGTGAMGEVTRATWSDRKVAIKKGCSIVEEAEALLSMPPSPYIATLLAVIVQDGLPPGEVHAREIIALVFEAGDHSLQDHLCKGPLDDASAWSLACALGGAVAHAKEHGIVHDDIKLDNVVVFDAGLFTEQFKLIDFGAAQRAGERTISHTVFEYQAPEVYEARVKQRLIVAASASDIWGVGLVLMLALSPRARPKWPYNMMPQEQIDRLVWGLPKTVQDKDLLYMIQGCLQRQPERRWRPSALERYCVP